MNDHDIEPIPNPSPGPLAGVRVLELGNFIAAPAAGRLLADFGADVIKIERPGTGDELRRWRLHGGDTSLLFRAMNRNKRSVTLDLKADAGQRAALRLAAGCDVVLENFRPGTLEKWGLGPDRLREVNPDVVLVRISGYGQTGPYRDRPGFGGVAEAIGGLRALTGDPDRPPTRVGVSLADSVGGLYAVIGTLLALLRRDRARHVDRVDGGRGEVVDVALYEGIYSLTESLVADFEAFGVVPKRTGSALAGVAPSNTYRCADGAYVVVSGNGDAIFGRLMRLVGRCDLAEDPALRDNAGRVARAGELDEAISAWTGARPHEDALARLEAAGVPGGPILTPADILKDPHYEARGMHVVASVPVGAGEPARVTFPGVVPRLEQAGGQVRWMGPELGADTDDVLAEAGLDPAEVAELRVAGAI